MATSGDTTFDCNRDEIIADALANVGALGPGQDPKGRILTHAARALNRVVKAIDADGKFLWRAIRRTQALTAGTSSYTLGADVLEVEEPLNFYRAGTTVRSPVRFMSQDDYAVLPDRTLQGQPSLYTIEYALPTTITMLVYPTPDATGDTIEYRAMLRGQDYDTGAHTGDFPARWLNALLYGLTAEIAPAYGQMSMEARFAKKFEAEKARQMGAGDEKGPTFLIPFGGMY